MFNPSPTRLCTLSVLGCTCALLCLPAPGGASPVSTASAQAVNARPGTDDMGVDIGIVKSVSALFLRPNKHPDHIVVMQPGERAILVSRTPVDGWMNVIEASSGHQGWVRASNLTVHLTDQPQSQAQLQSAPADGDSLPMLSVTNSAGLPLFLHLSQLDEIQINPHETKNITIPAGVHSFNAAIANAVPLFGYNEFPSGMKYSWNFVLTAGPQHAQTQSVSPEQRARIQQLQDAVNALQAEVKALEQQISTGKAAIAQQQTQLNTDTAAVDAAKAGPAPSSQSGVDDLNKQIEHKNAEAVAIKQAEDALNAQIDSYNAKLTTLKQKQQELSSIASSINAQP